MLQGLMMDTPLLVGSLIDHAARWHGDREIVTHRTGRSDHRYTYRDARARSAQLANALQRRLGVASGDRIATFAWNSYRHFELYFGVSGIGAVLHTVNPRLFAQQLEYIVNHAADRYVFVDVDLVPILEVLAPNLPRVEGYVILTEEDAPATSLPNAIAYEALIRGLPEEIEWPVFDERHASSLCYTSGTTGNPKGVLYSHRSTLLHTFAATAALSVSRRTFDAILPVVPMFHANAWGLPYVAAMVGAKFVLCDPHLDPAQLYDSLEREQVTMTCGVPTIWLRMLDYLRSNGLRLSTVEALCCGGSAPPRSLIAAFEEEFGITFLNAWGMTESSPVCTTGMPRREHDVMPQRIDYKTRAGRCIFGVEMLLVDDDANVLPMDGSAQGELLIRGPWIAAGYYNDAGATSAGITDDGWLRTGDIASVDPQGYVTIRDRSKDVIKSGGEWISSVDLENAAVAYPGVVEAAAVGVPHPTWSERPLLVIVPKAGVLLERDEILAFLDGKIAKWWMPDDVVFVDELPHTATGKISKRSLREMFAKGELGERPAASATS